MTQQSGPTRVLDTLASLQAHLKSTFANPPSLPTVKRWAAAGQLQAAHVTRLSNRASRSDQGGEAKPRPRYDRAKAIAAIQDIWNLDQTPQRNDPNQGTAPPAGPVAQADLGPIVQGLQAVAAQAAANTRALEAISQSVAQLSGVRTMLMSKYDAVNAQQSQIIEALRKRVADSESNASLARDIQSVRLVVARLVEKLGN